MTESIESRDMVIEIPPCTEISDPAVLAKIPLVSVKMITYNHAPFIAQAIEGVIKQTTSFPIELIIGEDCSTDETRKIVLEYQKRRPDIIRVLTSEKNVGMKMNGLRVMKACRGRYVAFCEGDDYWHHPYKLQKQVDYLEQNPECGLVYSNYDVYHVKTQKLIKDWITYSKWEVPEDPNIYSFFEKYSRVGGKRVEVLTCTVVLRRKLYEQIVESDPYLHKSRHFLMGDTQLWIETANVAKLHYFPESFSTHILTEESATRSNDVRKVLQFEISNADLMVYLSKKYGLPADIVEKHEDYKLNLLLRLAYYTKNAELAEESMRQKNKLNWKEWLRYKGATSPVYHEVYRALEMIYRVFQKESSDRT